MRVLVVSGNRLRGMGGTAYEARLLLQTLSGAGVEVAILAEPDATGIPASLAHHPWDFPPGKAARDQAMAAIAAFRPDLIHVIGGGARTLGAIDQAVGRVEPKVPWCLTIHNVAPQEQAIEGCYGPHYHRVRNLRKLPQTLLWRRMLRRFGFEVAICHSAQVHRLAVAAGCPESKLRTVPLTLLASPDLSADSMTHEGREADSKSPMLVTVGGFDFRKGQHDLVTAAASLRESFPGIEVNLIGNPQSPKYLDWLKQRIQELGMVDSVVFQKGVDEATKLRLLANAGVYVQASHEEGFCLAMLEAGMMSPRLVGTAVGAIPQIVEADPAGQVIAPGNPGEMARAIERSLASKPASENVLRERRIRLMVRFGPEAYRKGHLELYEGLISKQRGKES